MRVIAEPRAARFNFPRGWYADRNVAGTEHPSRRNDPAPDVQAQSPRFNVQDEGDIAAYTPAVRGSDAEIMGLDLFGDPAVPVYRQIRLPIIMRARPSGLPRPSWTRPVAGTDSGQRRRRRSVRGPKDAAVNAGSPAAAGGLPCPGRTRRGRGQEAVVFHQERCVAVGTGTGESRRRLQRPRNAA